MSIFSEIAEKHIKCEICGGETISMYGGGWDNDLIYCRDDECGAEYKFPTTTSSDSNESQ